MISTFQSDTILKASIFLSPSTWSSDLSTLATFGYDNIQLLQYHFEELLQCYGYSSKFNACIDE